MPLNDSEHCRCSHTTGGQSQICSLLMIILRQLLPTWVRMLGEASDMKQEKCMYSRIRQCTALRCQYTPPWHQEKVKSELWCLQIRKRQREEIQTKVELKNKVSLIIRYQASNQREPRKWLMRKLQKTPPKEVWHGLYAI